MTTLDEYVLDLNKEIDELRAKGNKSGLENVLAIKTAVLKLIAKECVAEYKELYGERVDKEYEELFGKQCIFFLTFLSRYGTIKIMKRDFWSGNHPLGHMTLLVPLSEEFE